MFALNKLLPAGALGFVALAVALVLGGGAPEASTPGLPDAGAVGGWLVPRLSFVLLVRYLEHSTFKMRKVRYRKRLSVFSDYFPPSLLLGLRS